MKTIYKVPMSANHPVAKQMINDLRLEYKDLSIVYGGKCPCCDDKLYAYELTDAEFDLLEQGKLKILPILGH